MPEEKETKHPVLDEVLRYGSDFSSKMALDHFYGTFRHKQEDLLSSKMLIGKWRDFVINQVKKPLMKVIILTANRLRKVKEPTRDNCVFANTHILFDIRDKFRELENNKNREEMFEAAFTLLIAEYEHDPYYRWRFDWLIEEINAQGWKERPAGFPEPPWWREFEEKKNGTKP